MYVYPVTYTRALAEKLLGYAISKVSMQFQEYQKKVKIIRKLFHKTICMELMCEIQKENIRSFTICKT